MGWRDGATWCATWGGKGKGPGKREPEEAEEAEEEQEQPARRKKKKGGSGWKEWKEKYTAFTVDMGLPGCFYTRLGEKQVSAYPLEIQEKLSKALDAKDKDKTSQDVEYDMTGGWVFNLRIISDTEMPAWKEKLSDVKAADGKQDGRLVGAQWDKNQATMDPRESFEKGVRYRPIFIIQDFSKVGPAI